MDKKFGFTRMSPDEFPAWITAQSISRSCHVVQEHHTWKPRYAQFNGSNHFEVQRGMRNTHMNVNGWSDIGQHFSIFPDGVIVTGRPLNRSPACILHANSGAICIENVGNFDAGGDAMLSTQSDAIFSVTAALLKKIGIATPTRTNVVYHHWYDGNGGLVYHNSGQKSCPGTAFFGGNQLSDYEANFLPKLQAAMGAGGTPPVGLIEWAMVTAERLNIRKGPSASEPLANSQGQLTHGAVVRVYEKSSNNWFRISQNNDYWISGRYTDPVIPKVVNTDGTNARIDAGTQHDVERVFQSGERVFVRGQKDGWSQIVEGLWIHNSLLT